MFDDNDLFPVLVLLVVAVIVLFIAWSQGMGVFA